MKNSRLLVTALIITGIVLVVMALIIVSQRDPDETETSTTSLGEELFANAADSDDECVVCHVNHTPGIVVQYGDSAHYQANVSCAECHKVPEDYAGAIQHPDQDFFVLSRSSPARCARCHENQVDQYNLSRHSLPAYVAYAGTEALSEEHLAQYNAIPEGGTLPGGRARNALYHLEGPAVTRFACETCHDVGKPNVDNSVGDCTACHLRHEFSLEQVRKPETCNACHIGPDHPQWEIYHESPHGIAYTTGGDDWNWDAEPGTVDTTDFPAPTCAICHFSGFGSTGTTHDVGDRLTWYLFSTISERRPNYVENANRMRSVCEACHSTPFIEDFYTDGDAIVGAINDWVRLSDAMVQPLKDNGLLTDAPFDEPIDYTYYELWHHWGRTAKFGAWMQGPDYTQWHGAYEVMHALAELREQVDQKLVAAGLEPLNLPETFPSHESAVEYLNQLAQPTDQPEATPASTENSDESEASDQPDAEATSETPTDSATPEPTTGQ